METSFFELDAKLGQDLAELNHKSIILWKKSVDTLSDSSLIVPVRPDGVVLDGLSLCSRQQPEL